MTRRLRVPRTGSRTFRACGCVRTAGRRAGKERVAGRERRAGRDRPAVRAVKRRQRRVGRRLASGRLMVSVVVVMA